MAEVLLKHLVEEDATLRGHVRVTSAGTSRWHLGSPMDPRARAALDRAGYGFAGSLAQYADGDFLAGVDVVLVMTPEHRDDILRRRRGERPEVILWRDLERPGLHLEVPDPYFGDDGDFDACLALLRASGPRLTSELRRRWDARSREA